MNWQPIETAPRDGTPVLLFCPGGINRPYYNEDVAPRYITIGFLGNASQYYADTRKDWYSIEYETSVFQGSELTGAWEEHSFIEVAPTHWAYLTQPSLTA